MAAEPPPMKHDIQALVAELRPYAEKSVGSIRIDVAEVRKIVDALSLTAGEAVVKPLEWQPYDMGYMAHAPFETSRWTYYIKVDAVGQVYVNTRRPGFANYFPSVAAAKIAVQADYEACIRSVLMTPPAAPAASDASPSGEMELLGYIHPGNIKALKEHGLNVQIEARHWQGAIAVYVASPPSLCPVPPHHADRCTCPEHATPPAPAATEMVEAKSESFARIVSARKAVIDATATYNARLEVVKAERERGNRLNVDAEYAAMSAAQSAFYRTVQDVADAALAASPAPAAIEQEFGR